MIKEMRQQFAGLQERHKKRVDAYNQHMQAFYEEQAVKDAQRTTAVGQETNPIRRAAKRMRAQHQSSREVRREERNTIRPTIVGTAFGGKRMDQIISRAIPGIVAMGAGLALSASLSRRHR